MPIVNYCQKCKTKEVKRVKINKVWGDHAVGVEHKQERLYIRDNRVFKGIGWYCPNCQNIDWDEKIHTSKPRKTLIYYPTVSYKVR